MRTASIDPVLGTVSLYTLSNCVSPDIRASGNTSSPPTPSVATIPFCRSCTVALTYTVMVVVLVPPPSLPTPVTTSSTSFRVISAARNCYCCINGIPTKTPGKRRQACIGRSRTIDIEAIHIVIVAVFGGDGYRDCSCPCPPSACRCTGSVEVRLNCNGSPRRYNRPAPPTPDFRHWRSHPSQCWS